MVISINIATQMARRAPLVAGITDGIMLGRQRMHFRPAGGAPTRSVELSRFPILAVRKTGGASRYPPKIKSHDA